VPWKSRSLQTEYADCLQFQIEDGRRLLIRLQHNPDKLTGIPRLQGSIKAGP
jgi:hypothetical protein